MTNRYINDPRKASVFSRYVTVTVVGKREMCSSNPMIMQGIPHGPGTMVQCGAGGPELLKAKLMMRISTVFICTEVVDGPDSQQDSTPKILRHPSPITAKLNSRAELTCEAEGAAVYDWFKNGTFLRSTGASGRFVIEKTAVSDSGVYYCVAISSKGEKAHSQEAKLTVGM